MRRTKYLMFFGLIILSSLVILTCAKNEWIVLFDGTSTDAWRGYQRQDFPVDGWKIENGSLKTIVSGDQCDIITKEKYGDFVLEVEGRFVSGDRGEWVLHFRQWRSDLTDEEGKYAVMIQSNGQVDAYPTPS